MNRFYCEKEREIVEALRCGALDTELERHAGSCAICSDTVAVSEFLQADRTAAPVLPDSDFIWWRGQLAGRQMAVERATRSIGLVRKITYLGISAAILWLVFAQGHLQLVMRALSGHEICSTCGLSESALLMGVAALIFTLLGSLYLAGSPFGKCCRIN
jgi:hypothetical protein